MTQTVPDASFWLAAWQLSSAVESLTATDPVEQLMPRLRDPNMQSYLFGWRREDSPYLLQGMVANGLFEDQAERPWPFVDYLARQVSEQPTLVAEAIVRASSEATSDLVQELLRIAVQLPSPRGGVVCAHLVRAWLRSDAQWFDATLWVEVLRCLSFQSSLLQSVAGEVLYSALSVSSSEYELTELLDALPGLVDEGGGSGPMVTEVLLEALETALAAHLVMSDHYSKRLSLTDLLEASQEEPIGRLVRTWVELDGRVEEPRLAHSLRLVDYSEPVLQQLGLRTLRRSIELGPTQRALGILGHLVIQGRFLEDHAVRPELLRLLSTSFDALDETAQVTYLERALGSADATDYPSRYLARDMLAAVRDDLGPRELRSLRLLESELGPYSPDTPSFRMSAGWVESGPAWSIDRLNNMSIPDVWALLRQQALVESGFDAERAQFELYQSVRQLAALRPAEMLAAVDSAGIEDVAVHASLVEGFAAALANQSLEALSPLLQYCDAVFAKSHGPDGVGTRMAVLRAVLTVLETATDETKNLTVTAQDMALLSTIVRRGLSDESPTHEDASRWSVDDLPTASLNVVRGIAVRAAFHLRRLQGFGTRSRAVSGALTDCLSRETTAPVLAAFGMQLPIVLSGPSLKLAKVLRSRMREDAAWSVLFSSYLVTRTPTTFDDELVADFTRAVELASREAALGPELMAAWPSLLRHLLGRYLFGNDASWRELTFSALESATPPQHAAALRGLGNAFRRNPEAARPTVDLGRLAQHALTGRRGHEGRAEVAGGALEMLTASRVAVADAGQVLRSLIQVAGRVPYRDLIPQLLEEALEVPSTVAQVLRSALDRDSNYWELQRFAGELVQLLGLLGQTTGRLDAQEMVETLGRKGFFFIEPAALELLK